MGNTRNFDTGRSRIEPSQFTIGGETYTLRRRIRPEVLIQWDDFDATIETAEMITLIDTMMCRMLIPTDGDRWLEHRQVDDESDRVLSIGDLLELMPWIVEQVTGRPSESPSSSPELSSVDGTTSTVDSRGEPDAGSEAGTPANS